MIDTLRNLLLEYGDSRDQARREALEEQIWEQFGAERSVLVWDMSGFSLLTRRHGIVHYLAMVRRMQEVTRPIVHEHLGAIVKFEADNGFAVFPEPDKAIDAAEHMNTAFDEENARYPEEFDIRVSCGIEHGRILLLEGQDFFGEAVNIACKLGEDSARPGEILIGEEAIRRSGHAFEQETVEIQVSGLELRAVSISC